MPALNEGMERGLAAATRETCSHSLNAPWATQWVARMPEACCRGAISLGAHSAVVYLKPGLLALTCEQMRVVTSGDRGSIRGRKDCVTCRIVVLLLTT